MTPERIDDFVERIDDDPRPRTIREVITTAVREAFEEAAKVCEDGVRDGPLSPAERYRSGFIRDAIRSLAEEVGK